MEKFREQCLLLSLTARMCVALRVFEEFCLQHKLAGREITEFSDYMWDFPILWRDGKFLVWEKSRPDLVSYGLGSELPNGTKELLDLAQIEESKFRSIIGGVVEILWGSFWGAAEHEQSLQSLLTVVNRSKIGALPVLMPFKFSRIADRDGWGNDLSNEDRDFWRTCRVYA